MVEISSVQAISLESFFLPSNLGASATFLLGLSPSMLYKAIEIQTALFYNTS